MPRSALACVDPAQEYRTARIDVVRSAGFALGAQSVVTQFNTSCNPDTYSDHLIGLVSSFVAGRQGVTAEEADARAREQAELDERGEYFFCLNQFVTPVSKLVFPRAGRGVR